MANGKLFRIDATHLDKEETAVYCLPVGFADAILSISNRFFWSRVWVENDQEIDVLSDSRMQVVERAIRELIEMSDIIVNVNVEGDTNSITSAGGGSGCGCGGGGLPFGDIGFDPDIPYSIPPYFPNEGLKDDGVNVPVGFESMEEYREYKCGVANQLVNDFLETVGNMQVLGGVIGATATLTIANMTGGAVVGSVTSGLIAAGVAAPIAATAVLAALIALALMGLTVMDRMGEIHTLLENNREQIVCAVFAATNPNEVKNVFQQYVDDAIIDLNYQESEGGLFKSAVAELVDVFIPYEVAAVIFKYIDKAANPDADCSGCTNAAGFYNYTGGTGFASPGWTTIPPEDFFVDGVRDSDGYDACATDGWCGSGDYWKRGTMSQIFTPTRDLEIRITKGTASGFFVNLRAVVEVSGVIVHQQDLLGGKFDFVENVVGYTFESGVTYELKLTPESGGDTKHIIESVVAYSAS